MNENSKISMIFSLNRKGHKCFFPTFMTSYPIPSTITVI